MSNKSTIRQVYDLQNKTPEELREIYNSLFANKAADNAGISQLRPKIAYRLQELAQGGLTDKTKAKLEQLAKGTPNISTKRRCDLLPGTKLCREYNDVMHEVSVLKDGFVWQGQKFKSLSAIARRITGTQWNGPQFFKLRDK